jgi:hypothetical protein
MRIEATLAALAVLTGAVLGMMTSFEIVHWTPAQLTLVGTEATAVWAFAGAMAAHRWRATKEQPVAVAGTVTALVSATVSLGIGFAWWRLTQAQNASLISMATAIAAVASALLARTRVIAETTGSRDRSGTPPELPVPSPEPQPAA